MCGRYTLYTEFLKLIERFEIEAPPKELSGLYQPRYNIAPTQRVLAVQKQDGRRRLGLYRWGLIPFWAKEASIGTQQINARIESAAEKGSFKHSFLKRRCLILADGFYEWKKEGKEKIPYYFFAPDKQPFAMAGLWDRWISPEGEAVFSCTILTREAAGEVRSVHDRMPVILPREEEEGWLSAWTDSPEEMTSRYASLSFPLTATRVSRLVNAPANDSPRCVQPENEQGSLF